MSNDYHYRQGMSQDERAAHTKQMLQLLKATYIRAGAKLPPQEELVDRATLYSKDLSFIPTDMLTSVFNSAEKGKTTIPSTKAVIEAYNKIKKAQSNFKLAFSNCDECKPYGGQGLISVIRIGSKPHYVQSLACRCAKGSQYKGVLRWKGECPEGYILFDVRRYDEILKQE